MESKSNGFGIAALVLSIIGLLFSFIPLIGMVAIPLLGLAFIFSVVGLLVNKPKGTAIAGLIVTFVSVGIMILATGTFAAIAATS